MVVACIEFVFAHGIESRVARSLRFAKNERDREFRFLLAISMPANDFFA